MANPNKFCVWGFRYTYNTFRHIHEAFYRALQYEFPFAQVWWLDEDDGRDFSNTFFISMNYAVQGMPRRKDCFYAIHNVEARAKEYLAGMRMLNYGLYVDNMGEPAAGRIGEDTYFCLQPWESYSSVVFRWGTDLLPHEIQANKPNRVFNSESGTCNFVGTAIEELTPFKRACEENGRDFKVHRRISVEENIGLIKASYMAPAINIPYQTEVGYVPCRIFKNISYGQFGLTNNAAANRLFGDRLIYNPDPYQLFYDGKDRLPHIPLTELHSLMDEVAEKHTYLNKIDALLKAAKLMENA